MRAALPWGRDWIFESDRLVLPPATRGSVSNGMLLCLVYDDGGRLLERLGFVAGVHFEYFRTSAELHTTLTRVLERPEDYARMADRAFDLNRPFLKPIFIYRFSEMVADVHEELLSVTLVSNRSCYQPFW